MLPGTLWSWRQAAERFLRSLTRRGLRGVRLVSSDAHPSLRAAANRAPDAASRRCRVHVMRNVPAHAGKGRRRLASAWIATAFAEADADAARELWHSAADQLGPRVPGLAALMDSAEDDVRAVMNCPREHRARIHSSRAAGFGGSVPPRGPLERLDGEIRRRTDVVGLFADEAATTRLAGAILLERDDGWAVQRRSMSLETPAPLSDDPAISLSAVAA